MWQQLLASVLLAASLLAPFHVSAQADAGCRVRIVPVTVTDGQGRLKADLKPQQFRGKFRGKPVQIRKARFETAPGRLVIVLDASGSMDRLLGSKAGWGLVASAIAYGPASEGIGLLVFGDEIKLKIELSPNRQMVADKLAAYLAGDKTHWEGKGRTALKDTIHVAMQMLAPGRVGDSIYLITDGGDNRSLIKDSEFERVVSGAAPRIYALVPQSGFFAGPPEERVGPSVVANWTDRTGGYTLVIDARNGKDLNRAAQRIFQDMRDYYQLEIELPVEVDKPRSWKLDVTDERGKTMSRYSLFYPLMAPCGAAPAASKTPP